MNQRASWTPLAQAAFEGDTNEVEEIGMLFVREINEKSIATREKKLNRSIYKSERYRM